MNDLWKLSAIVLARLIAAKQVSSLEVVEAHLARIAAINPRLNAIVRVLAEDARSSACAADRDVVSGNRLGPLHGVPFTVKANIDVAGLPTTHGVPAFANAVASHDAPVVERMRAAGGIPIARTNLPDMGLRVHTASSLYGLTVNPWNATRTAGGSSGGEAVALATGMTPIGLGNDLGGSLRNPATACGIASIRPSAGRVPYADTVPAEDLLISFQLMSVQGPMARRVADVRLGLQVMMGAHPRDPWSISAPFEGPAISKPIRVAVVPAPPGALVDPVVANVVRRAADTLADAGYEVVEACPPRYEEALAVWARFLGTDLMAGQDAMLPIIGEDARTVWTAFLKRFPAAPDSIALSNLLTQRHGIARAWSLFLADHPLILTPTWTQVPFANGFDVNGPDGANATWCDIAGPVFPANLLGLPSACVPAGHDAASNMPIGVLVTGQRFREDLCLDAAEAIEARLGLSTPIDPMA